MKGHLITLVDSAGAICSVYADFRCEGKPFTFRHTIKSLSRNEQDHDLRVSGDLSGESVIQWPELQIDGSDGADRGSITVTIAPGAPTRTHTFKVSLRDHKIPVDALDGQGKWKSGWRFEALVHHIVTDSAGGLLKWESLDRLRVAPSELLVSEAAQFANEIDSFLPLTESTAEYRGAAIEPRDRKRGQFHASDAASGWRDKILGDWLIRNSAKGAVAITGAGFPMFSKDSQVRVLPWHYGANLDGGKALPLLNQRTSGNDALQWRMSNFDNQTDFTLRAENRDRMSTILLPKEAGEVQLAAELNDQSIAIAIEPVEQLFYQSAALDDGKAKPDVQSEPFFLSSLTALQAVLKEGLSTILCLRITPAQRAQAVGWSDAPVEEEKVTRRMVVLSLEEPVKILGLGEVDPKSAQESVPTGWAGHISLGRQHVAKPVSLSILRSDLSAAFDHDVPRAIFDASLPVERPEETPCAPSPGLGWPTSQGTELSDIGQPLDKFSGSIMREAVIAQTDAGLAGRVSLTGWPAFAPQNSALDFYYDSRASVVFERQVASQGPPPRHLSVVPNRLRAPLTSAVKQALEKENAKLEDCPPITVPDLERGVVGLRPGVFHAMVSGMSFVPRGVLGDDKHQRIVDDDKNQRLDQEMERYGRPAHRAPVLVHQLRAPRGSALPKLSFRRTWLSEADKAAEFHAYDYIASVWRTGECRFTARLESRILEASSAGKFNIHVQGTPSSSWKDELSKLKLTPSVGGADTQPKPVLLADGRAFEMESPPTNWSEKFELKLKDRLLELQQILRAADGNTRVELRLPVYDTNEVPDFITLPLVVKPPDRLSLDVQTRTIAFGDQSYDAQLASPTARAQSDNGWLIALDRREYEPTATVYFAFGLIDKTTGSFTSSGAPKNATVEIPGSNFRQKVLTDVIPNKVYAIPLASWFANCPPGARLSVSIDGLLKVEVLIVATPQIGPPPSVYAVVRVAPDSAFADVPLYGSGPMPQRIEFPSLLEDLAHGHVRRRALFVWRWAETGQEKKDEHVSARIILVKVDRTGGIQISEPQEYQP